MKKVLTVLMIAVLAAGFVFADVSGYARMDFKYNTADGTFGFIPKAAINVKYALGETKTVVAEGDTYATADVDAQIYLQNDEKDVQVNKSDWEIDQGFTFDLAADVTGKIVAKDVVITLKTAASTPVDLASSAIDTYHKIVRDVWSQEITKTWTTGAVSLNGGFSATYKWYGFEVAAFGAKVGVDLEGTLKDETKAVNYEVYGLTPVFAYNGLTAQAGFTVTNLATTAAQISAKVGYAGDAVSADVASDVVIAKDGGKAQFDVAANAKYDFVSANVYYVSKASIKQAQGYGAGNPYKNFDNYMSARVAIDFAKFDVPVTFTATAKNLLNGEDGVQDARNFKFAAKYAGPVTVNASIAFCGAKNATKFVEYEASVDYAYQNYCTFNFGVWGKGEKKVAATAWTNMFMPTVSVASTTLVNGAELSLGWYGNTDGRYYEDNCSSILSGSKDCGEIRARVKINF